MINRQAALLFLVTITSTAFAQGTDDGKRPDVPGHIALDFGFNRLIDEPNDLDYAFWGSRTINLYYQYDLRFGGSKFSFHPGIGLGMERYKLLAFKDFLPNDTIQRGVPTLLYDADGNTVFREAAHYIYDADTLNQPDRSGTYATKKSMLALNYLDIPVEFRYTLNPDDPSRSFKVAIGGRVGYLLGAHTKLKYKENGELKKLKNNQDFNLNPIRYGAYMKVYIGRFSFFGYYNVSPLFEEGKGPLQTKATSYTVGISLASF